MSDKIIYVIRNPKPGTLAVTSDAPFDGALPENEDDFIVWRDAQPSPSESPVPHSVSPLQMRRALNQLGLRATLETAVAASTQDVRDAWEFGLEVRRNNALVTGMAAQMGMTDAQVDDLFRLAESFT